MMMIADANGEIQGKFTIPANVPSGIKRLQFGGGGGSAGECFYTAHGALERQRYNQEHAHQGIGPFWRSIPKPIPQAPDGPEPLAQTFTLPTATHVTGLDLWFAAKPTSRVQVQLRDIANGLPGTRILGEATLAPADVLDGGASTRILFAAPVSLVGGTEYAIVVRCDDPVGALSIAELGKFDATAQRWITSQPYTVGMLLSSTNGRTWTQHADRDMAFRVLAAQYAQTQKVVALGKVAVVNATDLMVMAHADNPASATKVEYLLTLPDGTVLTVSDGQPVQLASPITGDVLMSARLTGSGDFAAVLHPGTQLAVGAYGGGGTYITRAIPAGAAVTVKVIYEGIIPNGAGVAVSYCGIDVGDVWTAVPVTAQAAATDGFTEFTHSIANVNEASVRIKVELTGTSAARPRLRDFRAIVM